MAKHVFASGAERESANTRFDLISPVGIRRVAEALYNGSEKYGDRNWEKGIPVSNLLSHALGHIFQYLGGDRSEDHLANATFGLLGAMHFEELRPELVDVPGGAGFKTA